MNQVEIYFDDLSKKKQDEILKASGLSSPSDANWDVFPITVVDFETEEEEE